jgi:hypothetical protein
MTNFNIFATMLANILDIEPKMPEKFAVYVDDKGRMYKDALVKVIGKYVNTNSNTIKNTKIGSVIIFGNNDIVLAYKYDAIEAGLRTMSLSEEFEQIVKYIENYFENIYNPIPKACQNCPLATLCGICTKNINVNNTKHSNVNKIIFDGDFISMDEKVSIFNNFVKVGYDQYDITDLFGKEVVEIEGVLFAVGISNGRKALKKIA